MQLREVLRLGLIAALALTPAGAARAFELYLETVPTTSGDTCPEPCYQVRMFVEDPTRNFEIQAVQFDIDLESGGTPALLPIPPATNSNAAPGNVNVEGPDENIIVVPWNLSSTVGRSASAKLRVAVKV